MRVKTKNIATITFRCTKELHEQAEKLSELTMMPVSIMCRLALTDYIKNNLVQVVLGSTATSTEKLPIKTSPQKPASRYVPDEYDLYIRSLSKLEDTPKLDENGEIDEWL